MNKRTLLFSLFILIVSSLFAQGGDEDKKMSNEAVGRDQQAIDEAVTGWWTESMKNHDERIAWWRDARFGMFVHWGVYSDAGGEWNGKIVSGYSEHLMRKEKIPLATYREKLVKPFNPFAFDADKWIRIARDAGMKYFIITAKHHDGFAMFNSDVSDYDIPDATVFGKDPMKELAAACKKYGLKFGFYYSHAFDWEDPDAPGNDWDYQNPGGDLNLFGGRNWYDIHPELLPKATQYVNRKAIPQIRELLIRYHPDILWFDTPHKLPLSENIRILKTVRETDPNVVVNGRLARSDPYNFGDYKNTADRPAEFFPVTGDWEAIPTTNESYGYSKEDNSHKPASHFIRLLAKAASRGGNLLMNIGPMGNGEIDHRDTVILSGIGHWMKANAESVRGTEKSPLPIQSWGVCTRKGNRLFLHVFEWPKNGKLIVGGLKTLPKRAWPLAEPSAGNLSMKSLSTPDLQIGLPATPPDPANTVIVLEMSGGMQTDSVRLLSASSANTLLAFDASLHGEGFHYGDGKADRYYVDGWTKETQWMNWQFRMNEKTDAEITVRYLATARSGGTAILTVNGNAFPINLMPAGGKDEIREVVAGTCTLAPGVHELSIRPEIISGENLMQIFQVNIKPAVQPFWQSRLAGLGENQQLVYHPDEKGNTLPDFSRVGFACGDREIPEVEAVEIITSVAGDDRDNIQSAIDRIAARPLRQDGFRGAVLLRKGTYDVNGSIFIKKSGIVVRGEGTETVVKETARKQIDLFVFSGSGDFEYPESRGVQISEDFVPVGRNYIVLSDASSFAAGDSILLYRPGTANWVHDLRMDRIVERSGTRQWDPSDYDLYYERIITDITGDTVFLDNPVVMELEKKYGGGSVMKYHFRGRIRNCGIEDLSLESEYLDETDENHGWNAIRVSKVEQGWVQGVVSKYFGLGCVYIDRNSRNISVLNSQCLDPKSVITGGRRYSFNCNGQLNLFRNCYARNGRHDYVTGSRACGPNVFTHCSAQEAHSDIGPHHRWASGTLYDRIVTDGAINVQDRGNWGSGHGWAGVTQVVWNCSSPETAVQSPWVSGKNYCIGLTGSKYPGRFSDRPDGGWEGLNRPGLQPVSLYEAQLRSRLSQTSSE
ncbi:MAG: alpha-L-fucosidase [Mangrovibacterium sp.]